MVIRVHTRGVKGSETIKDGEQPTVLLNCILELDGHLYGRVTDIKIMFGASELAEVTTTFYPGSIEVVPHTAESWEALADQAERRYG